PLLRPALGRRPGPARHAHAVPDAEPGAGRAALAQLQLALHVIRNLRELYQYRALLWSLTVRELRARYRASVLGFLWTFLNPTLQMAVYALVFGVVLKAA